MILYRTRNDLAGHLDALRGDRKLIGLVPTMGALHGGHLSLVEKSAAMNQATVVTIFVNPTQFNDPSDLARYPRTLDRDLELLKSNKVDVVFHPSVEEMYPEPDTRVFDLGGLDRLMEGARRPGHFNGVAQIVTRLFDIVRPHRAYFGQKDFQQLVIVRQLARDLYPGLEIVACPIVREQDGLAMSSRNALLGRKERKIAPRIHQILDQARQHGKAMNPDQLRNWVKKQFDLIPELGLEYFEIVEDKALIPVTSWDEKVNKVACIAVLLGGIRLIDNMNFD
jgi:pantoate--beta-alanine ligase